MEIKVTIKNVYGIDTVYPACDKADTFARIAGTRTLTDRTINQIKQLGYTITIQQQKVEL